MVVVIIFYSERPHFVEEPKPQEVGVGDAVTLTCRIAGSPDISVAWFKGDGKLRKSHTCLMEFANGVATLTLTQTTKFDRGEYICKAENRVGSASTSCRVMVKGDACSLFSVSSVGEASPHCVNGDLYFASSRRSRNFW